MTPDLRQLRYFVAVAEELNFTRAAERLHMAQPPLSAAIKQLEEQLGVALLERTTREVRLTAAGALLLERAPGLLAAAEELFAAVQAVERGPAGRLRVGVAPPARFGLAPELAAACSAAAPGVMLYTREDTTAALMREVKAGRIDLVLGFCAAPDDGLDRLRVRDEPAVLHVALDHPLALRERVSPDELAGETFLIAGGPDSPGYTTFVVSACRAAGFEPQTLPDPYPDLGLGAVSEGLGVAIYVRSAFPPDHAGSAFVPIDGVTLPFDLLWRRGTRSGALDAVLEAARGLQP